MSMDQHVDNIVPKITKFSSIQVQSIIVAWWTFIQAFDVYFFLSELVYSGQTKKRWASKRVPSQS